MLRFKIDVEWLGSYVADILHFIWDKIRRKPKKDQTPAPPDTVVEVSAHPQSASGAQREKLGALPYDLIPYQEMTEAFSRVAEHGAVKYAPWNWSKGLSRVQLMGSLLRHTFAYLRGEERDPDSGLLHTDHILWNAAVLAHNVHWSLEDGRRPEPPRSYKEDAQDGN